MNGHEMKRIVGSLVMVGFGLPLMATPAGAKPLSSTDKRKAIAAVERSWGECLALVGESTVVLWREDQRS